VNRTGGCWLRGERAWAAIFSTAVTRQQAFTLPGTDRPGVLVHMVAPPVPGPGTRITIVLHGTDRNAGEYCAQWTQWAMQHDRIVLAPQFDHANWPGRRRYVLGGVLDRDGTPRPRSRWTFTAVTDLHRHARERFGLADEEFDLWGHSAGAQFVHRYLLFEPAAPVRTAIAANAGWYTLPDLEQPFPYGLAHPGLHFTPADVVAWAARPLVLMRGCADIERDEHLRTTPEADAQGPHRFARAAAMHRAGHAAAAECRWRLVDVPFAAHDFAAMVPAAQVLLAGTASRPTAGHWRSASWWPAELPADERSRYQ